MKKLRRHIISHSRTSTGFPTVEFCDSCATVRTGAHRASALRERSLQTALRFGPRI